MQGRNEQYIALFQSLLAILFLFFTFKYPNLVLNHFFVQLKTLFGEKKFWDMPFFSFKEERNQKFETAIFERG